MSEPVKEAGSQQPLVRPSDIFLVTRLCHVPDNVETGKVARNARTRAGLSLREVARRMKLSAPFVSDLELGRRGWNETLVTKYQFAVCPPRHTVIAADHWLFKRPNAPGSATTNQKDDHGS